MGKDHSAIRQTKRYFPTLSMVKRLYVIYIFYNTESGVDRYMEGKTDISTQMTEFANITGVEEYE